MDIRTARFESLALAPLEAQLSALLGPLRRAVLRRTRAAEGLPDLPESQIELLRLLVATGGLSPSQAARELEVAQSTISNLLRTMTAADLIERRPLQADGRGALLVASARARGLLDRYDRASAALLRETLDGLPADDRRALESSLPALRRLLTALGP